MNCTTVFSDGAEWSLRDWLQNEDNIAGFGTEYPQTPALGTTLLITLAKTKYTLSL